MSEKKDLVGTSYVSRCKFILPLINNCIKEENYSLLLHNICHFMGLNHAGIVFYGDTFSDVIFEQYVGDIPNTVEPSDLISVLKENGSGIIISSTDNQIKGHSILMPVFIRDSIIAVLQGFSEEEVAKEVLDVFEMITLNISSTILLLSDMQDVFDINKKLKKANNELELVVAKDVEELCQSKQQLSELQYRLQESEKFSVLGKMVAAIIHEIKSPLTAINGYSALINKMMTKKMIEDPRIVSVTKGLDIAVSQLESIVSGFLSFSRRDDQTFKTIDIREVLNRTSCIVKHSIEISGIDFRIETDCKRQVRGQLTSLAQVFINLVVNAQHALSGSRNPKIVVRAYEANDNAVIEVQDNGPGIKEEHIPHIFDCFYTTKGVKKSTGLGLFVCKNIIDNHGGSIDLISRENLGTKFLIRIPLVK